MANALGVVSGAAQGAKLGANFGPVGAGIGAVAGAIFGGLSGGDKPSAQFQGYTISGTVGGPTGFKGTITAHDQLGHQWTAQAETEDLVNRGAGFWNTVTNPDALAAATRYFESGGAPVTVNNFRPSDFQKFDVELADSIANQLQAEDNARRSISAQLLNQLTSEATTMAAPDLSLTAQPAGTPTTAAAAPVPAAVAAPVAAGVSSVVSQLTANPLLLAALVVVVLWALNRKGR